MRPMRGPDDAAERGQDEGIGSPALSPPRVRGLFELSSAMMRERSRVEVTEVLTLALTRTVLIIVRYYHLIGTPAVCTFMFSAVHGASKSPRHWSRQYRCVAKKHSTMHNPMGKGAGTACAHIYMHGT